MRISDWSSDVCSSDQRPRAPAAGPPGARRPRNPEPGLCGRVLQLPAPCREGRRRLRPGRAFDPGRTRRAAHGRRPGRHDRRRRARPAGTTQPRVERGMSNQVSILAERLDSAAYKAAATPQLEAPISLEDAYAVQRASIERRIARGEKRIGIKMGFTSRAKLVQMGVSDLI